jgi:hypothetical protein
MGEKWEARVVNVANIGAAVVAIEAEFIDIGYIDRQFGDCLVIRPDCDNEVDLSKLEDRDWFAQVLGEIMRRNGQVNASVVFVHAAI